MDLLSKFTEYIKSQKLFSEKDELLLAVSGGVDSVVLCELCELAGFNFTIAHCNFKLRNSESDRDEQFVIELGKRYSKKVLVESFDTKQYAHNRKLSIQAAARELRYNWFKSIITGLSDTTRQSGLKWILTAHQQDDNSETMAMNFFKGTGIAGLHGILPKQDNIIRPLLFASKKEIVAFANTNNLSWIEDSSNADDHYTRNFFRNRVIPLIQQVYPEVASNMTDNAERFREVEIIYQETIEKIKKALLESKGNEVHIPVLKLQKLIPVKTIIYEIIRDFGFSALQTKDILNLLSSESGKYVSSATHRIIKNRQWLIIAPQQDPKSQTILIEQDTDLVNYENGQLHLRIQSTQRITDLAASTDQNKAFINAAAITYPLVLRKWKQGDYFYPLGMKKKKKLARFFIDQKLSKTDKEKVWVIEMNQTIIWVVGMRIDNRFRIDYDNLPLLIIEARQ